MLHFKVINVFLFFFIIVPSIVLLGQSPLGNRMELETCIERALSFEKKDRVNPLKDCLEESIYHFGRHDSITAFIIHKVGTAYFGVGDFDNATNYWEEALIIRDSILPANHSDKGITIYCLGVLHDKLKNHQKAIEYFKIAAPIQLKNRDTKRLTRTYDALLKAYKKIGDYENALKIFKLAVSICDSNDGQFTKRLGTLYQNAGNTINESGNPALIDTAIVYFKQAESFFYRDKEEFKRLLAYNYSNSGNTLMAKQNFEAAAINYKKSIDLFEILREEKKVLSIQIELNLAKLYINLGLCFVYLKNTSKAKFYLEKGLTIGKELNALEQLSELYDNLGEVAISENDYKLALEHFQQAIELVVKNNNNDELGNPILDTQSIAILSKPRLVTYLSDKARCFTLMKNPQAALATHQTIDHLLHLLKQDLQTQQSQLFWREKAAPIYQSALETAHQLYQKTNDTQYLDQMFQFSEKNKASILYDAIAEVQAKEDLLPLALLKRERAIKTKLGQQEQAVVNQGEDNTEALSKLISYREEYQAFIDSLEQQFPNYYNSKYKTDTTTIADIQRNIIQDEQTAILEYFVTDQDVYLFTITKNNSQVRRMSKQVVQADIAFDLDTQIKLFYQGIQTEQNANQNWQNQAHSLYKLWLEPALIDLPQQINRLIIVRDGKLNYVPFEALITHLDEEKGSYDLSQHFLLRRYQCTYAYSASLLQELQEMKVTSNLPFMGFAPDFSNLKNQRSVQEIKDLVGGQIYVGNDATRQQLLDLDDDALVLHLGTHALMDDEEPLNCRIFMANNDSLSTAEIYNFPIKTQLVVLAACQTGLGQLRAGAGMMSLGRAFMYSGSPSVVTSLWSVSDQETSILMKYFYKNLKSGMSKDQALHQAKLRYLDTEYCPVTNPPIWTAHYWNQYFGYSRNEEVDFNHPFYWSAFLHIGNTASIDFPFWETKYWLVLIGIGLLLGLFFMKKSRNSNKPVYENI